jgi:CheY-like chemotaxis protein
MGGVRRTVLVVDDNPGFRVRARRYLNKEGFTVVAEAESGEAALEAVREHRPDVVLLDVHLPGMSGLEVAQALRDQPGAPAVVLTSTREASDFGDRVALSGARGFVPKYQFSAHAVAALLT